MKVEISEEKHARQITTGPPTTHRHTLALTHTIKILRLVNFLSHNNILCQRGDINVVAVKRRKEKENRINVKLFKTRNSVRSRPSLLAVFSSFSLLSFIRCCCCRCFPSSSSSYSLSSSILPFFTK